MAIRKDLCVLVVDDMPVGRQEMSQMLEQSGVRRIRFAASGAAAISDLKEHRSDIVIANLHMTGTNGLELLKKLRRDPDTKQVRFVMTSHEENCEWVEEAQKYGLDQFLPRPFDGPRLARCVDAIASQL